MGFDDASQPNFLQKKLKSTTLKKKNYIKNSKENYIEKFKEQCGSD